MRDLVNECNQQGLTVQEFEETFCLRCKQPNCVRAAWGQSRMDRRVQQQVQRLLHPTQADPTLAKYAHLVDFEDMRRRVKQLQIADARGDWEVPDVPAIDITDGRVEVRPSNHVDEAIRAMARAEGRPEPELPDPEPEAPVQEPAPSAEPATQPTPQKHIVRQPPTDQQGFKPPTATNTATQQGVMIGGGPPPPKAAPPAQPQADPWAIPASKQTSKGRKGRKVKVGATVRMGAPTKK